METVFVMTSVGDDPEDGSIYHMSLIVCPPGWKRETLDRINELLGGSLTRPTDERLTEQGQHYGLDEKKMTDEQLNLALDARSLVQALREKGVPATLIQPDILGHY